RGRRGSRAVRRPGLRRRHRRRRTLTAIPNLPPYRATMPAKPQLNPVAKLALELGPLVLFFAANARWNIFVGTAAFMAAALAAFAVSYLLTRHVPLIALISAIVVIVFGGLTLVLHDATFIKLKPTILYTLFAAILLGGLVAGKSLLEVVFDQMFHLT